MFKKLSSDNPALMKSSLGKKSDKRRSLSNTSFINNTNGRQIYDRGKTNERDATNFSVPLDNRKHTVFRITIVKHAGNHTIQRPKVLINGTYPSEDFNSMLLNSREKAVHDILQDTKIPLTFHVNTKPVNEDNLPMNEVLSDKPFANDKHQSNTTDAPSKLRMSDSASEKNPDGQEKLESNVILETKMNPVSIGINLDEDKTKEARPGSSASKQISLQDVLEDIDYSSRKYNATRDVGNPQKDNSVLINLNDIITQGNEPTSQSSKESNDKSGKVQLEATSHKDKVNGTEVETAGVSITTESKGLPTGGLIKTLLSKLLGTKISEELKGKVADEFQHVSGSKITGDSALVKITGSRPHSLDEASTSAGGTLVESSPGTVQGVDTAEPNNQGGEQPIKLPLTSHPISHPSPSPPLSPPPMPAPIPPSPPPLMPAPILPSNVPCIPSVLRPLLPSVPPVPCPVPPPPPPVISPLPNGVIYGSTKAAGQGVESPPGTIMAVGTSTAGNEMQRGDNGKLTSRVIACAWLCATPSAC